LPEVVPFTARGGETLALFPEEDMKKAQMKSGEGAVKAVCGARQDIG
jgi:hypothetical protein